jgi:cytochrome b
MSEERQKEGGNGAVQVWDLFIRIFHWTLALSFVTAFISGELGVMALHVLIGYLICVLLVSRLFWGFKGSEYARFSSFFFSVDETRAYVRGMLKGRPQHYFGHNPAGALMVFTLLALLILILMSGLLTLAAIDYEGPLLFLANRVSDEASYAFRGIHEFLPIVGLVLVVLHILGVAAGSIQHKENLVRAMLTGKKPALSHSDSSNQNEK